LIAEAQPSQDPWWKKNQTLYFKHYFGPLAKIFGQRAIIFDQSKAVRNDPENYAEMAAHPPKHRSALRFQRSFPGIFPQKNALNAQSALDKNDSD
jgi:hypothetical protein